MTQLSREHEAHKTHHLKIYPEHFSAVLTGVKRAELRKNDRDYKVGDTLHLMETPKGSCSPTGEFVNAVVTHITDVSDWLPGYVLLSIERDPLCAAMLRPRGETAPLLDFDAKDSDSSTRDKELQQLSSNEPVSQPYTLPDGKPSFGAMMRALGAFYVDEDVPENAMLAAFKILVADVRAQAAQQQEVNFTETVGGQ